MLVPLRVQLRHVGEVVHHLTQDGRRCASHQPRPAGAASQLSEKQREVVGKWRRDFGASFGGTAADESDSTAAAVAEGPDDERTG